MKRWQIGVGIAVVVVAAAVVAGLPIAEERIAQEIKARVAARPGTKVGTVQVSLLQRGIVLGDVEAQQPGNIVVKAARIESSGLAWPIGDLIAGRTPFTGWRWGDPVQAERVEMTGLEIAMPDEGKWSVAKVVAEGVDLARHTPLSNVPAGSYAQEFLAFSNLSVRRFEERDLVFVERGKAGSSVRMPEIVIEGLERGRVKSTVAKGTEIREVAGSDKVWLGVGEIAMRAVDMSGPLAKLANPDWKTGMPAGRAWAEEMTIDGLSGDTLVNQGMKIGRISVMQKREGEIVRGRSTVESFVLKPDPANMRAMQSAMFLKMLDLTEINAKLDCTGGEERAKGELGIDRCVLTSPGLAEIELSLKLVGADAAFWRAMDEGNVFGLLSTKVALGAASVSLRDETLRERLIKLYATNTGLTPANARALIAREIRRFQPPDMLITEEMTKLADTIARFVEQGGKLTVEAKPDPPLDFQNSRALLTPGPDVISVLGLKATLSK